MLPIHSDQAANVLLRIATQPKADTRLLTHRG